MHNAHVIALPMLPEPGVVCCASSIESVEGGGDEGVAGARANRGPDRSVAIATGGPSNHSPSVSEWLGHRSLASSNDFKLS